jgi:5-methylcytosine-specific restriction endonuclease McrA
MHPPHESQRALRARLFAEYFGRCAYCPRPAETLDHVVPLALGGPHSAANLVPACNCCNTDKGDTPLIVWLARRAPVKLAA